MKRLLLLTVGACSTATGVDAGPTDATLDVPTEAATDALPDAPDVSLRNTCEWRYVGLTFPYVKPCPAGDTCKLDVGVGTPDVTYRGVYCETSSLPANCGDLVCEAPDWRCEDATRGRCVSTRAP